MKKLLLLLTLLGATSQTHTMMRHGLARVAQTVNTLRNPLITQNARQVRFVSTQNNLSVRGVPTSFKMKVAATIGIVTFGTLGTIATVSAMVGDFLGQALFNFNYPNNMFQKRSTLKNFSLQQSN